MVLVEIVTAGAISAYFVGRFFSSYSFGSGLVFWITLLLCPKLRISDDRTGLYDDPQQMGIGRLAKLITVITIVNLCGCWGVPFKKLPLLVRFLVLFQMSSNVALLLILAIFRVKKYIMSPEIDVGTSEEVVESRRRNPQAVAGAFQMTKTEILQLCSFINRTPYRDRIIVNAMTSTSPGDPGLPLREIAGASASRVEATQTSITIPTVPSGVDDADEASGSESANGGAAIRDRDLERGRGGGTGENSFKIAKLSEMSIILTAQITGTIVGFNLSTLSHSTEVLLCVALVDQLVGFLCCWTGTLVEHQHSDAAKFLAYIGIFCTYLGYILMVAMLLQWYIVVIVVLLVGVIISFIYFGLEPHVAEPVRP